MAGSLLARTRLSFRDGGEFDAVAEVDEATQDPSQTGVMRRGFVGDDRLHPDDAPQAAMAEALGLSAFRTDAAAGDAD